MSASEWFGAIYMTAGLSHRVSELHELDRHEYVPRHSKP